MKDPNRTVDTQHDEQPELELLTSEEYSRMLRSAGYSHSDMAKYLGRSRTYITSVANSYRTMTFRQVQELEDFLGERLYAACLNKVRKEIERETPKRSS